METKQFADFYRPTKLEQIVGQDHAVAQIQNMFKKGSVPHTIGVFGPTGVAKTTIARIIGKLIAKPDDGLKVKDYHEESLGSERGIDATRDIVRKSQFAPVAGNYVVFCVDEIAKATSQAFSPLLPILEKPPKQTVFILVTDEPGKLPKTIHDRAYKIQLNAAQPADVRKVLLRVMKKEDITFPSKKVVSYISNATQSYREALTMLQQARDAGDNIKNIMKALQSVERGSEFTAMSILINLYNKNKAIFPLLLKPSQPIELVHQLLRYNEWMMTNYFDTQMFVWQDKHTEMLTSKLKEPPALNQLTHTHNVLVNLRKEFTNQSTFEQHHSLVARLGSLVFNI